MKKLLALLLAVLMMFSLAACGGDTVDENPSSTPAGNNSIVQGEDDFEDDLDDDKELIELGDEPYVVCVKAGSTLEIKSIEDIKGLRVGYAYGGDGEKIAKYYNSEDESKAVGFGGENDAFSELEGGTGLDCVIVKQMAGKQYQERGRSFVILDPIVIPEKDLKK